MLVRRFPLTFTDQDLIGLKTYDSKSMTGKTDISEMYPFIETACIEKAIFVYFDD